MHTNNPDRNYLQLNSGHNANLITQCKLVGQQVVCCG